MIQMAIKWSEGITIIDSEVETATDGAISNRDKIIKEQYLKIKRLEKELELRKGVE